MALFHKMTECGKDKGIRYGVTALYDIKNWNFKTQDKIDFLYLFEVIFF